MKNIFIRILEYFLGPYDLAVAWESCSLRKKTIIFTNFRLGEGKYIYCIPKLSVRINKFNISKKYCDLTLRFEDDYDFTVSASNYPDKEHIIVDGITFNAIRKIMGPSELDNWSSNVPVHVDIYNDINWTPANLVPVGNLELTAESFRNALISRNHMGTIIEPTQKVKDFILETEDETFYQNKGLIIKRLKRAVNINISTNRPHMGASSLTCQLIKNAILVPDKTFRRKFIEALMALITENYYHTAKDDIMQLYVNMVETGPNTYGLEDGARLYFGKSFEDLSKLEVAVMSYLLSNPVHFYNAVLKNAKLLHMKLPAYLDQIKGMSPAYIDFAPPLGRYMLR